MAFVYGRHYGALGRSQPEFVELLEKLLPDVRKLLAKHTCTCVAVTGSSGLSVGFGLRALGLECELIVVRKPGESSHAGPLSATGKNRVAVEDGGYLFLDDLIDSGDTLRRVARDLDADPGCILLYNGTRGTVRRSGVFTMPSGEACPVYGYKKL